ncbi:MAG TPA: MraY family glycosyltransferase [Candidatus Acidoferrum sp.]|nr:MraY family glycosyltransferase [Candidatus Acidoferrum sp.]
MLIEYIILALASAVVTIVLIPAALSLSRRYSLYDYPGRHKRHKRPVSLLGGTVLFVAMWLPMLGHLLFAASPLELLSVSLPYIYLASCIIYLIGVIDDFHPVSAWVKLLAEIAAGIVLCAGGLTIDPIAIPFLGQFTMGVWSYVVTVAWVVGLTNAINLIDGLDGLAGGVSLVAAITLAIVGIHYEVGSAILFAYTLIGFLPPFLYYNRYPARIFLGDSGALQIGFYFAVISLIVPIRSFTAAALYVPLLALGVPLLETISSFFRRVAAGKNVMQADRRHLFHYLALAGLSHRQVVLVFYVLSVVFGLFALAMVYWNRLVVLGVLALFMVVISVGFLIFTANPAKGRRKRPNSG